MSEGPRIYSCKIFTNILFIMILYYQENANHISTFFKQKKVVWVETAIQEKDLVFLGNTWMAQTFLKKQWNIRTPVIRIAKYPGCYQGIKLKQEITLRPVKCPKVGT